MLLVERAADDVVETELPLLQVGQYELLAELDEAVLLQVGQ